MPRVAQSAQSPSVTGVQLTYSAPNALGAGNGDVVSPNNVVLVKNGGASALTITVKTGATVDGLTVADRSISVPAGQDYLIGPFPPSAAQPSGTDAGKVYLEYSAVTSVTRAVLVSPF